MFLISYPHALYQSCWNRSATMDTRTKTGSNIITPGLRWEIQSLLVFFWRKHKSNNYFSFCFSIKVAWKTLPIHDTCLNWRYQDKVRRVNHIYRPSIVRNRYIYTWFYSTGHWERLISNIIMADRKLLSPDRAKGKKNMGQWVFWYIHRAS